MTTAMRRRTFLKGLGALTVGAVAGLPSAAVRAGSVPAGAPGGPVALSTTGMVGDLAARVLGDAGRAETLMGDGVDPHLYRLTRADLSRLVGADIVFYNGLLLEGRMTDALARIAASGKPVIPVTERLDPAYLLESEDYPGQHDPHVWMDVSAWMAALDVVRDGLSALRPDRAAAFAANAEAYRRDLQALDGHARRALALVPPASRVLVTAHDAFRYFGRAYGCEVEGIQGLSTESEAGVRRITELVDMLVARGIGAVFVESTVSDRNVRALIEGAAAQGHRVTIGGELYSDAMGPVGTYEGTYVGMIDHNVTTIARALGADVPSGGFQGRLGAG